LIKAKKLKNDTKSVACLRRCWILLSLFCNEVRRGWSLAANRKHSI